MSYLVSAGLLVVATITATTGLVSELWDINDFVFHKYAAYSLVFIGLAHVFLHWGRLVSYTRWRLRKQSKRHRSPALIAKERSLQRIARQANEESKNRSPTVANYASLSRRDFLSLVLGGVGGFALGRFLRPEPDLPYGGDLGTMYHEWSKPKLQSLFGAITGWGSRPPLYKEYTSAERISLHHPEDFQGLSTEDAIQRRRSARKYSNQLMTLEELSQLLYNTGGINADRWGNKLRSAPSAGALYPIEVYLVIHRVEGLEAGVYHYAVKDHALELLLAGNLRGEIVRHGLMQEFLGQANLVLVFTAILQRLRWKYQERAYRYALIEAGHLGQNVYLAATSMGMGACAVGAFLDDNLNAMLGVDGRNEAAVYMLSVGKV
jgi:SagB-type dehydrogenase family enzyme